MYDDGLCMFVLLLASMYIRLVLPLESCQRVHDSCERIMEEYIY